MGDKEREPMHSLWRDLVTTRSTDETLARREQLLNMTVAVMVGLSLLNLLINGVAALVGQPTGTSLLLTVLTIAICLLAYGLGRSGRIIAGGYVIALMIWLTATGLLALGGWYTTVPVGFILSVSLATILSGWQAGTVVGLLSVASFTMVGWQLNEAGLLNELPPFQENLAASLTILITTVIAACALFYTLDRQIVAITNRRVNEMRLYADELERIAREREQLVYQLQSVTRRQDNLLAAIREVSAPVLPLFEGLIVMPLVGQLDAQRAALLLDDVLEGINRHQADTVLLDMTGMSNIDTESAQRLIETIRGAQMLGSECKLVGVQPAVAQELIALNLDLARLNCYSTLQEGLADLIQHTTGAAPKSKLASESTRHP